MEPTGIQFAGFLGLGGPEVLVILALGIVVVRRQEGRRAWEGLRRRDPQLQDCLEERRRREDRRKEAGVGFEAQPASWAKSFGFRDP